MCAIIEATCELNRPKGVLQALADGESVLAPYLSVCWTDLNKASADVVRQSFCAIQSALSLSVIAG